MNEDEIAQEFPYTRKGLDAYINYLAGRLDLTADEKHGLAVRFVAEIMGRRNRELINRWGFILGGSK